jgi:glycosyltransferase involved in cell wall biosynthesis
MVVEGLVSTIIPVHNRPALLRDAVLSVLAQTYRPVEVIVVDDGSTDGTGHVAEAFAQAHPEVRVIHRENGGPGAAREAGRSVALGEFIQYLDSDDLLLPEKFALQVSGLRKEQDCTVSYGQTRFYVLGESPLDIAWKRTGERVPTMFPSFLQSRWWDTSTPLYRRAVTERAGPWTSLTNEEDWEYDCRIASQGIRLHHCASFVSETRLTAGVQLSRGNPLDAVKLRSRAAAHSLILQHARRAEVPHNAPEMRHFIRALFLLSRQCGAAGLESESAMLFALARNQAATAEKENWDFRLYGLAARVFGWSRTGRLACRLDKLRP